MSGLKVKKLPAHIYTDSLNLSKSNITKLNTDIRANVMNISSTKIEQLPKNFTVNKLIVDSKTAKNMPFTMITQCNEVEMDGQVYASRSFVSNDFNFCSMNTEAFSSDCTCV